jgi:hypothetical protein
MTEEQEDEEYNEFVRAIQQCKEQSLSNSISSDAIEPATGATMPGEYREEMGFKKELEHLINKYSQENGSNTPDFILAVYLNECLNLFNETIRTRNKWYGNKCAPGILDSSECELNQEFIDRIEDNA